MDPSGLPIDGLTHVNFAFAYIKPETYEITTMDAATPANLFQTFADVRTFKSGNSDLKVFVSIGGWTFSDDGTKTQPLFGEIAGDEGKRQKFADNVVKFMNQYGFDGVDLDWEWVTSLASVLAPSANTKQIPWRPRSRWPARGY